MKTMTTRAVTPPRETEPPAKTARICPWCEEEIGGTWCNGRCNADADVTNYAALPDVLLGGGR